MSDRALPPSTPFVAAPYKRPTGQSGTLYAKPGSVAAIGGIDSSSCSVLLAASPDWLTVNMSADDFLGLIGGVLEAAP